MSFKLQRSARVLTVLAAIGVAGAASAATSIRLQPDEASSKDVFVYEFGVPGAFGIATAARSTNLDTQTLNALVPLPAVPFGNFLGSANTDPLVGVSGEERAHDTRTLIQFDLGFLRLSASQVAGAWINVHALPGLPPFTNPTVANPIVTELRSITQAWGETTATWDNRPGVSGVMAEATQTGVNQWVRFDVTSLVKGWLANPGMNHGVELSQPDIMMLDGKPIASLYASSAFADADLRPYLSVSAVPEPETYALMLAGLGLVGFFARRKARAG